MEEAVSKRSMACAAAHGSDENRHVYISASRGASSVSRQGSGMAGDLLFSLS